MRRAAEQRIRPDDVAGEGQRQIVLAEAQHVGECAAGDVGPVVHREQRAVPLRPRRPAPPALRAPAWPERTELCFTGRALVPQLDDVHATGECRVGELGQVTALPAGVGAQVQGRGLQTLEGFRHSATVATTVDAAHTGVLTGG